MGDLANELSERDKLQKDLLWGFYLELRATARQVETTRSNATSYGMLVASALIAVISLDKTIDRSDRPLCLVLVVVSLFTSIYSLTYAERYVKNKRRAHFILEEIDRRFFGDQAKANQLLGVRDIADATKGRYTTLLERISRMTVATHVFWLVVPSVLFVVGSLLLIQTFTAG